MKGGSDSRVEKDKADQEKTRTKTWADVVKGLKENGSETADSVEQFDSEEPNHLKAKQIKGSGRGANTTIAR